MKSAAGININNMKKKLLKFTKLSAIALSVSFLLFILLNFIFPLKINRDYSTIVEDKDGNTLYSFLNKNDKWRMETELNEISPKYFATWRTPILAGRDFDDRDTLHSPLVAIVNETFARKYLGGANPIGATFRVKAMSKETGPYQIVGLAKDTKLYDLREEFLSRYVFA